MMTRRDTCQMDRFERQLGGLPTAVRDRDEVAGLESTLIDLACNPPVTKLEVSLRITEGGFDYGVLDNHVRH